MRPVTRKVFTHRIPFLCAAIILSGACSVLHPIPGWVREGVSSEYPRDRFVSALGTGQTLADAQSASKAELTRVFSAELVSEIRLIDEEFEERGSAWQRSKLTSEVAISTDVELEGVEAPLSWTDARTGAVWSMAVLDRNRECLRIRAKGRDLVQRMVGARDEAKAKGRSLPSLRATRYALALSRVLDSLEGRSRVVGMQCLPRRPVGTATLFREEAETRAALRFSVRALDVDPGDGEALGALPQLGDQIARNLTRMGFQAGGAAGPNVIPVTAEIRLREVNRGAGRDFDAAADWVEYRWEGAARMSGTLGGSIVAAESEGAESHPEASTARLRARRQGELDLSRALDRALKAYLDGSLEN